jgi:ATP-dependent Lon protease
MIRHYTREAGVRGLERELAKLCRRVVKANMLDQTTTTRVITEELLEEYLGVTKYRYGLAGVSNQVGQVTGLAWTSVGGELLTLEAAATAGKGRIIKTGSLGDVMQESIQAALTVVRSRAESLGINAEFFEKNDIHVHVPEGATPKDGPSAGIGMATALASVLTGIPVKAEVAMTGEITLRGKVLAIGGLKEKLLAAHRGGIKTVIIPKENEKDLRDIPENIKQDLTVVAVDWIDEVLDLALESSPDGVSAPIVPTEDTSVSKDEGSRPKTH